MYWQYQTIIFEFRKDGLLGDKYIDDVEVENILNEQGNQGWELVSVTPVQEGLMAFLKKQYQPVVKRIGDEPLKGSTEKEEELEKVPYNKDNVFVKDGELVGRSGVKQRKMSKGGDDHIGGIKIS